MLGNIFPSDSDNSGLEISDLMMALVAVFLLGSVLMRSAVGEFTEESTFNELRLDHMILREMGQIAKTHNIEIGERGLLRFRGEFGSGVSGLSDELKVKLDDICPTLKSFVKNRYRIIESVVFEGHTSKQWKDEANTPYYGNKEISNWRAVNTMRHCLGESFEYEYPALVSKFIAVGHSYSRPIKNAQGNIDWTASKRVDIVIHAKKVRYE